MYKEPRNNNRTELNACLLRRAIEAYNSNDPNQLAEMQAMGFDTALLERISQTTSEVFTQICAFDIIEVRLDPRRVELLCEFAEREKDARKLINRLIELGASQSMLHELVGLDPREFRNRRKMLGLPAAAQGRPADLTDEQADRLYHALRHGPEDFPGPLERYRYLGEETGLPLAQIWTHLRMNEEEDES